MKSAQVDLKDDLWRHKQLQVAVESKGDRARQLLIRSLDDPSVLVRDRAAELLGEVGKKKDVALLLELVNDPFWPIRASAILAAAQIDASKALPAALEMFLHAKHPVLRRYASMAITLTETRATQNCLKTRLRRPSRTLLSSRAMSPCTNSDLRRHLRVLSCLERRISGSGETSSAAS